MPSREELLRGIQPGMKLDKAFFLRIYGYKITWPGFKAQALAALQEAGCSKAKTYYDSIVGEYEARHSAEMRDTARRYRSEYEREWKEGQKRGEGQREQERIRLLTRKKELLNSLKSTGS